MNFKHLKGLVTSAKISKCGNYRYLLEIQKKNSEEDKTVCVIMQNPSIANTERSDKSVNFLENLIFIKNYKEFKDYNKITIVNQFAHIQTNDFIGNKNVIGDKNDTYIRNALEAADTILVAWGVSNKYTDRINAINKMISKHQNKPIFKTRKHPSRGAYKDFILPYEIS